MLLHDTIKKVGVAHTCEDLFGPLEAATLDGRLELLRTEFRAMAHVLHPDVAKGKPAAEAMKRLNELRKQARAKLQTGEYGKVEVTAVTIKTSKVYENVQPYMPGDLCDVYSGQTTEAGKKQGVVIKVVRSPKDTDLLDGEVSVLKHLWEGGHTDGDHFTKYLPRVIEAATLDVKGVKRRANVLTLHPQRVPLQTVVDKFPAGIDARDMAWMFRRILEILTWVHRNGVVHGAITPAHVLISTRNHSIKLVDWCYSCRTDRKERIKAIPTRYEHYYPPEVFEKKPVTPATDIYMAALIADKLLRGHPGMYMPKTVPPAIVRLLDICTQAKPAARYQSAWEVYQEFDAILRKLYGKPAFREFKLPA